jgi:pyroglutamyl-peptidase
LLGFYVSILIFPKLVVHVGVSSLATGLTLELQAHKSGYCRKDVEGKIPPRNEISSGKSEVIQPVFDVEDVCREVDKAKIRVPVCCSSDAGRYFISLTHYVVIRTCAWPFADNFIHLGI